MKLERIEIKNYRSLFHDYDENESFTLDLGDGMNAIAGPNNVGKSNVFRALAFALDPDFNFDRSLDKPSVWRTSKPAITLTFKVPEAGRLPRENTLLKYLEEYERAVRPDITRTFASQGIIKLRVTIEGADDSAGTRRQVFVVSGVGARSLPHDHPLALKALKQFHSCFHFVMISSGQSLESLMEGKFRDILRNVLRDNLKDAYDAAERSRNEYCADLQSGLLRPLTERINDELAEMFPEITSVSLSPEVLSLDETLSKMRVQVSDAALTDLADKGTGVRGGLIIAILRHFADVGKRSMLFVVEEPESFLHPAAQEQLRDDLEALARRKEVSLLVSTHSPYIVSRHPEAKVFSLAKGVNGGTRIDAQANGDEPHAGVLAGLFRNRLLVDWLDNSIAAATGAELTIVVEGGTDAAYAEIALERAGRLDLLEGVRFLPAGTGQADGAGGAALAAMQAIIANAVSTCPVAVLLDGDGPGKDAAATLARIRNKTKDWQEKKTLFSYRLVFGDGHNREFPFEAEDLWPNHLIEAFLSQHSDTDFDQGKRRLPKPETGWHYDLSNEAKGQFVGYLRAHAAADDCERWVQLFELIRKGATPTAP